MARLLKSQRTAVALIAAALIIAGVVGLVTALRGGPNQADAGGVVLDQNQGNNNTGNSDGHITTVTPFGTGGGNTGTSGNTGAANTGTSGSAQHANINVSASFPKAEAKLAAGDLLGAREIYNQLLLSGKLSANDAGAVRQSMTKINDVLIFSRRPATNDLYGATYTVRPGDMLSVIARRHGVTWELLSRINKVDPRRMRVNMTLKVLAGPFYAVVDKSDYRMDVYLGAPGGANSMYVRSFPVGLGTDDSTPTGTWLVSRGKKLKNPTYYGPRGSGIIDADDPKNPLGERWIGLEGVEGNAVGQLSYGIHGTNEPESIGKSESLGCIRLHNADAELVYDLLVEGKSKVVVQR